MDCPNCGAYNDARIFRCRRCGHVLPPDASAGESTGEQREDAPGVPGTEPTWGPASESGRAREESQRDDPAGDRDPWRRPSGSGMGAPAWSSGPAQGSVPPGQGAAYATGPGFGPGTDIPNYLWQSIAVTICCCLPLGIPAIVFASRVNPFLASGDYTRAKEASDRAKNWALASFAVGLLWAFCWVGLYVWSVPVTFTDSTG